MRCFSENGALVYDKAMTNTGDRTLILFDIDGTLLYSDGCGRAAVQRSLLELYQIEDGLGPVQIAGQTDRQLLQEVLRPLGYSPEAVAEQIPCFAEAMVRNLLALIGEHDVRATPGAHQLITDLSEDPHACLGLVTGNLQEITPIKLRTAGFDPGTFAVGAFGGEAADRCALPPLAIQRAADYWQTEFPPEHIVIVGDTPNDVSCARAVGVRVVAVLTGPPYVREALHAARPDVILNNLADQARAKEALFGEVRDGC